MSTLDSLPVVMKKQMLTFGYFNTQCTYADMQS